MIKVEILDKCTLLQACEWIAFKWSPMDAIYEQHEGRIRPENPTFNLDLGTNPKPSIEWEEYRDNLRKAVASLHIALFNKQVNAVGVLIPTEKIPLGGAPLQEERGVIKFEKFFTLDTENNRFMVGNDPIFYDILIDFSELASVFPGTIKNQPNGYKSKYMLLMDEVINQEGITDKNQSKHDILTDIFKQKLKANGIRESNNLASAMATLIRQPWAQAGRKKKG